MSCLISIATAGLMKIVGMNNMTQQLKLSTVIRVYLSHVRLDQN